MILKTADSAGMFRFLRAGIALSIFLFGLSGCPEFDESRHVFYDGNGNTSGYAPVDSTVYFSGDRATVLDRPPDMKKGSFKFLGWRQRGNDVLLQPGEQISIGYEDVWLYAWWEGDPDNNPYTYIPDPDFNGGVMITGFSAYVGFESDVIIPEFLDKKPVTGIGEGAFGNAFISRITLPPQLKTIGNKAFAETWLGELVIPDTVVSIGKLAFQNSHITALTLGSGLESIGDYAFDSNQLAALFLPEKVGFIGEGAFYGNALVSIKIGADVEIKSASSLGTNGASFLDFYIGKGKKAGVYLLDKGVWQGLYTD